MNARHDSVFIPTTTSSEQRAMKSSQAEGNNEDNQRLLSKRHLEEASSLSQQQQQQQQVNKRQRRKQVSLSVTSPRNHHRQQRVRFALFLKILLKRLEQENEVEMLTEVKSVVRYCNWQNKMETRGYENLVEAMEVPVRRLVGEIHWIRSHNYMNYYYIRKNIVQGKVPHQRHQRVLPHAF